jgi:uncharacterized YigZ family protein
VYNRQPEQSIAAKQPYRPEWLKPERKAQAQFLVDLCTCDLPPCSPTFQPSRKALKLTSYPIPAQQTRIEITVGNSRFIATAAPVFSVDEAKAFVARIKHEFADASHNVSVYLVGHGASVTAHCTDDGEPAGTAGRPALAVLQGSGLGDVAVVVTRYFGGTKLGTGGLVRAYGDTVREVLAILPRAQRVPTCTILLDAPYSAYERLRLLVEAHGGQVKDQEFGTEVTLQARFPQDRYPAFESALKEGSNGRLEALVVEQGKAIVPIDDIASS